MGCRRTLLRENRGEPRLVLHLVPLKDKATLENVVLGFFFVVFDVTQGEDPSKMHGRRIAPSRANKIIKFSHVKD